MDHQKLLNILADKGEEAHNDVGSIQPVGATVNLDMLDDTMVNLKVGESEGPTGLDNIEGN